MGKRVCGNRKSDENVSGHTQITQVVREIRLRKRGPTVHKKAQAVRRFTGFRAGVVLERPDGTWELSGFADPTKALGKMLGQLLVPPTDTERFETTEPWSEESGPEELSDVPETLLGLGEVSILLTAKAAACALDRMNP
jgi:hypothetical protein